jgi:hypothetical protein
MFKNVASFLFGPSATLHVTGVGSDPRRNATRSVPVSKNGRLRSKLNAILLKLDFGGVPSALTLRHAAVDELFRTFMFRAIPLLTLPTVR